MLDMETPGQTTPSVTPSAPQRSKESTPTAIPEKQLTKIIPPSPQIQKPNTVPTLQKNLRPKSTLLSKISSPFSKSNKSKKTSGSDPPFRNLCEEPASPGADSVQMEVEEEEGVNESGELLLPSVPSHEPGLMERVRGRVGEARKKYGPKQAESIA